MRRFMKKTAVVILSACAMLSIGSISTFAAGNANKDGMYYTELK